jgi:hypothetical protein
MVLAQLVVSDDNIYRVFVWMVPFLEEGVASARLRRIR